MAVAVARAKGKDGQPLYKVVGVDLANQRGQARIDAINAGRFPFETTDAELVEAAKKSCAAGNLSASADAREYEDADIIVVDVHLDVDFGANPPRTDFDGFKAAIRSLAKHAKPGALVLVETTVPPGTTESVVKPEIRAGLEARKLDPDSVLIAHSYERVMPGRDYLSSVTHFWRVYSGVTEASAAACEAFLKSIIDTDKYPLTRLSRPVDSESAKLLENTFRAVNIALVDEWGRFAERAGVDLLAVIQAIRRRPTHQNIMRPGFGVGGYCLTKDPLLVGVGAREFFGLNDLSFPFAEAAVRTNQRMPMATLVMVREALGGLSGQRLLLLGASYKEDVADTRYSASAEFVRSARAEGAHVDIHDPLVDMMEEVDGPVIRVLPDAGGYAAVIFAVGHRDYRALDVATWLGRSNAVVVDANSVLTAAQIDALKTVKRPLRVIGRGDL